jgi:hypothetical protein
VSPSRVPGDHTRPNRGPEPDQVLTPRRGIRTPMLASRAAIGRYAELMESLGAPVEALPGPPGDAATRNC